MQAGIEMNMFRNKDLGVPPCQPDGNHTGGGHMGARFGGGQEVQGSGQLEGAGAWGQTGAEARWG